MAGQAGNPSAEKFDISELEIVELGTTTPNNIVDVGEDFQLRARIEGDGAVWDNLKTTDHKVKVRFYAEGMGPAIPDQTFGAPVFLDISADDFWVESEAVSVADEGVYRCHVIVEIWDDTETHPWKGWVGYNEDCVLQVNPHEE
jgi:hypothetical protein